MQWPAVQQHGCQVPWAGSNNDHLSVATGQDDPLEVGDGGGQRHLVNHHNLTNHMKHAIILLADRRELAI